jgi:NAD(P)-dependent dehydrogenase (short-subunit alcohol dehydrogenase family)
LKKTVLITGAGTGMGRSAALLFSQRGWNVAATMFDPIAQGGAWVADAGLFAPALDVTDSESIRKAVSGTIEQFGRLDVIVNNAGYAQMGPLEGIDEAALRRQFDVNVFGATNLIREVLPHFRERASGTIINVTSMGGRQTYPLASAYHGTKYAMEGLSESLQFELRPFNIRVKIVEPGGTKTDFITAGNRWAEHSAYKTMVDGFRETSLKLNAGLKGPEPVAEMIYRAATDSNWRIRYPVNHQPYALLRSVLSDRAWQALIGRFLSRQAKP